MDSELHISRYYMPNTTNINSKLLPKNAQTTGQSFRPYWQLQLC